MKQERDSIPEQLPQKFMKTWFLFCAISALIWLLCFVAHKMGQDRQIDYLLKDPFTDITVYFARFKFYRTPNFFEHFPINISFFAYPPAAALVYYVFYTITPHARYIFAAVVALWTTVLVRFTWIFCVQVTRSNAQRFAISTGLLLFSFPFVFLVQRGNIEVVLWAITATGLLAYLRGRWYLAAVLLGVGASIKLYPILLLGLFLSKRRDLGFALIGVITFAATTLLGLWTAGPGIVASLRGFADGMAGFQSIYAEHLRRTETAFDHSFYSIVKIAAIAHGINPGTWTHTYYLTMGLLTAVVFFTRVNRLPVLNRMVFLLAAMVSLPPVSYEYTLVNLYCLIPLFILAIANVPERGRRQMWLASAAFGCLLCLLMPIDIIGKPQTVFAGQIQAVILLMLLVLATVAPWRFVGDSF